MILPAKDAQAPAPTPRPTATLVGAPPPSAEVQPTPALERRAYRAALAELRDEYKGQLRPTIDVLVALRDDPKTPAKERINAAKELARWLGVSKVAEEKAPPMPTPTGHPAVPQAESYALSDKELSRITALANGLPV
jgi:hypothetical protein